MQEKIKSLVRVESRGFATPCWTWTRKLTTKGYGRIWRDGKELLAHRASYEAFVGPIPAGLQVDHLCRNRDCVNHEHLEAVTPRENTLRGEGPAGRHARKTACPKGHPYDEANTYVGRKGWRYCRTCRAAPRKRKAVAA